MIRISAVSDEDRITASVRDVVVEKPPAYTGDYEIAPTLSGETIPVKDLRMAEDIKIAPIPLTDEENLSGIGLVIG